ncbi:sulfite exporter TauE/SafE family protein [Palleronia sp. LCG004]|uniref:sulfite exporter TauE/SafE family protein n=1 Tax=Palleronia sp. LCG004 TaxID=3079304 RepID=UPI002943BC9E|nr:sulfite exporter TauE/SafE family protein [Palleronia sp. LCG004]WOI56904.1 sulfite exporter TauE/SafE family protein [Palleronia sp. LCG004]
MELTASFFAVAIPATIFAGISKGGFGSGAAFVATVLLVLVVSPAEALAVMLPLLMLMDATALRPYWRKWDGMAARWLVLGAVPGVVIGAMIFTVAPADVIALLIGVVALSFVAFQLVRSRGWLSLSGLPGGGGAGAFWGAVAGFTSFISHAGGPPAAVYLLSRGVGKERYQATTVIVFWAINLMKFALYAVLGTFSSATALADLVLAPFAILGVTLGVWLHRRVPERLFFGLTYAFLVAASLRLVWSALA